MCIAPGSWKISVKYSLKMKIPLIYQLLLQILKHRPAKTHASSHPDCLPPPSTIAKSSKRRAWGRATQSIIFAATVSLQLRLSEVPTSKTNNTIRLLTTWWMSSYKKHWQKQTAKHQNSDSSKCQTCRAAISDNKSTRRVPNS